MISEFSRAKIRKSGKVEKKKYLASQRLVEVASESRSETTRKAEGDKKDLKLNMEVKEI